MSQNFIWPAITITPGGGGATSANQVTQIALETAIAASVASIDNDTLPAGQATMAASSPVVIASNQSAIAVTGPVTDTQLRASAVPVSLTSTTITGSVAVTGPLTDAQLRATAVPVSGTVSTGGLTDAELRATAVPVSLTSTTVTGSVAVTGPLTDTQLRATAVPVSLTSTTITGSVAVTGPLTDAQLRATAVPVSLAANQSTNVAQINGVTPLMGNGVTGTGSLRVTLASDTSSNTNALLVNEIRSATATLSNVASSASSVSLLASNASRKGATIYNDSTQSLYVKFGATASATSFTVLILAAGYYELPTTSVYTGAIDGIWAGANGSARITELS